ncbi:hypothetical protein MTR_5g010097 [Medicago truncatula]|uniref:Uncharacterized protein n=1 Tax=Medicago truncatula TaxID=3880 RepID=A0A072UNL5_MEDTR|nr:hypothetical protein MTR_5g010097 [Medicago truncatula]
MYADLRNPHTDTVIGEKQWMWTNMVSWPHQTLMSEKIGNKVIAIFDACRKARSLVTLPFDRTTFDFGIK